MTDAPQWTADVVSTGKPLTLDMIRAAQDDLLNAPTMRPIYNRRLYERFGILQVIAWEPVTQLSPDTRNG